MIVGVKDLTREKHAGQVRMVTDGEVCLVFIRFCLLDLLLLKLMLIGFAQITESLLNKTC